MAVRFRRHPSLSPEHNLLLACARSMLRPDHVQRIRQALPQGIHWDRLWSLARLHGVGFFLGNHLCQKHSNDFSLANGEPSYALEPKIVRRIKEDLWEETAHALVLREQQLRLNAELAGTQALWLKGLSLAERLYGRWEARHCGDLDLLVAPADVPRVENLLDRLGFERFRPPEAGKEFHPLAAHHSMWRGRVLPDWWLLVELHHRLSGPAACQPAAADLLRRSRLVDFDGQEMRVPALEDELLILGLHAHQHNYALLRCLMDVAEFVRRFHEQIDWARLVSQAREGRSLGRLRAALEISNAVLGLEQPENIFSRLPPLTPRQEFALRRLSVVTLLDPRTQQDDLSQAQWSLLMDSWGDAIRLLAPRLIPPREHVRDLCPPSWRRTPGLPYAYYYLHSADQVLKRGRSWLSLRAMTTANLTTKKI